MNKTAREIQDEIMAWATKNFEHQDTVGHGMAEEIGEFCHHVLKFKQNIRGHTKKIPNIARQKQLTVDLRDALGDAMVFCLQWAGFHQAFLSFDTANRFATIAKDMGENEILGYIFQSLTRIFQFADSRHVEPDNYRSVGQKFLDCVASLAEHRGWDFEEILNETWNEVKKRDWIKYPKTGLPVTGT